MCPRLHALSRNLMEALLHRHVSPAKQNALSPVGTYAGELSS
jgi:hypothetical protein